MINFLNKIARLASIQNILLLSHQGEILFCKNNDPSQSVDQETATSLHRLNAGLNSPQALTLHFEQGFFYLHKTTIGSIIIMMKDDRNLAILKDACENVEKKLEKESVGKKVLLSMLDKAGDKIKPQLIRALIPTADKEVAVALIELITNRDDLAADARDTVLLVACQAIGHCSYFEASTCLQEMLSAPAAGDSLNPYIVEAGWLAIAQLQRIKPVNRKYPQTTVKEVALHEDTLRSRSTAAASTAPQSPKILEKLPEKKKIDALVATGKKGEALKCIIGLIETATQKQQFDKAEAFQEWLLLIEPMALTESIRAAELIEESKKALINTDFYTVWRGIVKLLSTEEFIALYHAMNSKNYPSGEHIVRQGQIESELFFVNSGRVQLYTHIEGREIPLQLVEEGGIIGHSTFFELSVWTSGAISQGAEVYLLSYDNLQKLDKKFPGIESKMADYCSRIDTSTTLVKKMKRSRRQLERKVTTGRLSFVLLAADGTATNAVGKGNILDISQGGLCFTVHSSKRKNTHMLFGKRIQLLIKRSNSRPDIERNGRILAVRDHDIIGNTYSVHTQFDTLITGTEMREVVAFNR